ncbi:DUF488 domain-containing protein [Sinomicrobium soli]|uniref:DUF488 domain-containing protein n=1 Tax=Sinomicrobium sp. N-1-3-6 TaxID=2219864 RepID=UPI000DCCD38E|nr:DUF488 family protein [Sinomicrobium sp. N-1-3-6]RAV30033.1 DUF488 domain-containing protein [Sinomicrobium sp. N-1-3-6]
MPGIHPYIVKRIYEHPAPEDGYRILIDKLWPRGVKKEAAGLDEWDKDIAPSDELRRWFGHRDDRFEEFGRRYKEELKQKRESLDHIRAIAKTRQVCLLYGARNTKSNHAIILKEVLETR